MKVLHIISGGDIGGAKTHLISLAKELRNHVDMKILCFFAGATFNEAQELGLPVQLLNQRNRYDFGVVRQITEEIKNGKYDIVHCHGSRANWYIFLARPFIKVPLITTIHSDYKKDFEGGNPYRYFVFTALNSLALRFFNYYITISTEMKNILVKRGFKADKIFAVYNGINFNNKVEFTDRKSFADKYKLNQHLNKKWIGIAARLEKVKGIDVFINGANVLLKLRKDVHFIIAGDGLQRDELLKLCDSLKIKEHITFLGHISDINSFYNSIDINCITSYSETFGYVLAEGARFKVPAVSSEVGGVPEIIKDGKTGLLFKSGEYKQFSNCLIRLLNDNEYANNLGENLYTCVRENFSVENMINKHIEIYNKIAVRR